MSFLDSLIKDPNYQSEAPRKPEEVTEPGVIISPDTRRENRIPPGQSRTKKWPVLDAYGAPSVDLATWTFEVEGLVANRLKFSLDEFLQLPAVKVYADFHCVTRWSRLDNVWTGVSTREIAERAGVSADAKFVLALAYDNDWTTNVPIEYFLKEDSLFAFLHDGQPIPPEHGGPVRLIIPQLYAWKSAKWVKGVSFLAEDEAGFWEEGGYHMRGNPWVGGDGERFRWS
ncbi:MAG TPA: sulfite oxidase-like oxidoreductase [Pyrinomonadaceae bacterium]|jgi:DMSO/TMAO reductase YedYZ molybdopterin-dependent catalytic subunit|nr:sulfite oxidase-like oxidoreductase [Pyrinomonadaceae bacterium]